MRPRRKSGAPGVEVSDWHNSWPSSVPTINTWPAISVRSPIWGLYWCNGQQEAHIRAIRCRETCLGKFEIQYNERKLGKSRSNPLLFIAGSPISSVLRPNNQIRGFMNWTGPHTLDGNKEMGDNIIILSVAQSIAALNFSITSPRRQDSTTGVPTYCKDSS